MNSSQYLRKCATNGEEANFETQFEDEPDRVIDAEWIRQALLANSESNPESIPQPPLPGFGETALPALRTLRIRGARIRGELDLKCCGSAFHPLPSLSLQHCHFEPLDEQLPSIDLSNAHLCSLNLSHSRFKHLRANGMHVEGSVDLCEIRPLHEGGLCWCKLAGVFINGHLLADAVHLRAPAREKKSDSSPFDKHHDFFELDWGLNLYMSEIGGSIMLRKSAHIEGGFLLDCAHVKGDVRMDSSTIASRDRSFAIAIERTTIGGNLTLARSPTGDYMRCEGVVWLWHTTIGGSFALMDAQLHGLIEKNEDTSYLIALYAGFMKVSGSVTIENVRSQGLICLQGMEVGNYMSMQAVKVTQGASQLPSWFRTPGWMLGTPEENGSSLALDMRGVQVATTLSLKQNQLCGGIDLTGACCKTLDDDEAGYSNATPVVIDGLTYERLEHFGSRIGEDFNNWRLTRWLPTDIDHYVPQPFVQLAHVLAHHGDDAHARDVLVDKAWLDAKRNWYIYHRNAVASDCAGQSWHLIRLWIRRAIYFCFIRPYGTCFDFGLSPGKALFTLVSAILFGWLAFSLLNDNNMMVVAQTPVAGYVNANKGSPRLVPATTDTFLPANVPCGSDIRPLVYATDVFIPLVDLREESKCDVDAALDFKPGDWVVTACRFFKAAYALLGWVVTTLALLTFSGVMRHRLSQD